MLRHKGAEKSVVAFCRFASTAFVVARRSLVRRSDAWLIGYSSIWRQVDWRHEFVVQSA